MKILLGGVPFGCDNIGDEAILACVVRLMKETFPEAALTVATADPATADLLDVNVVPAYGFAGTPSAGFAALVRAFDAYIWCGATGLSDYPHVALDLLEMAQQAGVKTFVWGVGMDDELNPVFFRAAGRRRQLLSLVGLVGWYERRLRTKLAQRLQTILPRCCGVWLRDPQSVAALKAFGFEAGLAADTAMLFPPPMPSAGRTRPTLGLCLSAQRQITDFSGAQRFVDAVRAAGYDVVGLPMNPKTDREPLARLGVPSIEGTTPEAIMAAAATCRLVLSSRLHLLILSANVGTPGLGLARGSKLANWLANFGETVVGSVADCDWPRATELVLKRLADRGDWDTVRATAYRDLKTRLETARAELRRRV